MEHNATDFTISTYPVPQYSGWVRPPSIGVRVTHISGEYAECSSERSQHANRAKAFGMLIDILDAEDYVKAPTRTPNMVLVDRGALAIIIQALRRDAAEGRLVRGEMADIIEKSARCA